MSRSINLQRKGSLPGYHKDPAGGGYLAGDLIDNKYKLTRTLGQGGMGVVWVARNVVLDVDVALKLIPMRAGAEQPVLTKRLLQEARAAAQLAHPAICRVFDYGQTHLGDPFVVSELMHGETFADILDSQTRLPATRAAQLLLPVIDGLAMAHTQGIVHRDVKPENIFLSRDVAGRVQPKLLDFGIARFVDTESKITVDGALLGTPSYMSPEQARGEGGADLRTDVWSICIVLYEALCGEVPFEADNYNAILYAVINTPAGSILERGAGDPGMWRILERGLRKEPEERWESMQELGEEIARWLYGHGIREDACGASLRSGWLQGALSDGQFDLPPEEPAIPLSGRKTGSALAPVVPVDGNEDDADEQPSALGRDSAPSSASLDAEQRPARSRSTLLAMVAGVLVGAIGLYAGLTAGGKSKDDATAPARSGQVVLEAPAAPAPATPSAAASATADPEVPEEEAAPPPTTPLSATQPAAPRRAYRPSAAAPRPGPAPTPPSTTKKKKKRRDFGF